MARLIMFAWKIWVGVSSMVAIQPGKKWSAMIKRRGVGVVAVMDRDWPLSLLTTSSVLAEFGAGEPQLAS